MSTYPLKKLSEILIKTETINPLLFPNKDYIYIDVSSVSNLSFKIETTSSIKWKDAPSRARKLIKTWDIIFATVRPTLNRIAIISHEFNEQVCSTWYFVMRWGKDIAMKYLYYFLFTESFQKRIEKLQRWASYPAITDWDVRNTLIPLPPLSVQEEIVVKLNTALASIEEAKSKTEQALAATRELWESTIEEAFRGGDGWEQKRLEEVCDRIMDGTHFSPKNSTTGERLYVSAKNIKLHGVDFTKATYISEADHKVIYKRCPVKKWDVLYIKDGATTGIATINNLDEEFSLLSSVAVFQVTKKLLLEQFLVYYLNSWFGKKHMLWMIDGTAITRLTLTKLNSGIIPLAPLPEQSRIVAHLDAVRAETEQLTSLYEQKLADLDELRQSVLQEAFTLSD